MSKEELDLGDIPGLGPVRRAALAEAGIHDLEGLLRLKVAELAAIRGVGHWQARKIAEFLRQRGLVLEMEVAGGDPAVVIVPPETLDDVAAVADAVDALKTQAALEAHLEAEVAQLEQVVAASQDGLQNDALTDEQTALVDSSTAIPVNYEETVREVLSRAAQPEPPSEAGSALNGSEGPPAAGGAAAGAGAPEAVSEEKETEVEEPQEPVAPEGGAEGEESAPETAAPEAAAPESEAPASEGEAPAAPEATEATEATEALQERIREQRQQLPEAALELMEAIRAAAVNKQLTRQITRLLIIAGEFVNDARPLSAKQREAASQALDQAEEALRRAIEKRAFGAREQKELAARIRRRRKQLEQVLERE